MQRRDFLKYFISLSAVSCCACKNHKDFADNEERMVLVKGNELQTIKIPICYHCNLNCASCCHFSPLAPEFEMPEEIFERDIKQLHKVTKGKLKTLKLLGGEPLLHKNIEKLLNISAKYFPNSEKKIISNGILLENMPVSFWKSCRDNNFIIDVRNYENSKKTKVDVEKCYNLADKYKVSLKITPAARNFILSQLTKKGDIVQYKASRYKCPQLDNGLISPCAILSNIRFFNNYFKDYALPVSKDDYLDLYKISSIEEIKQYFSTPKELCKYCGYGKVKEPWHVTKYDVSEWYKV